MIESAISWFKKSVGDSFFQTIVKVIRGGGEGAVVKAVGIALRAGAQFCLAAWLQAEGYGFYAYVTNIVAILSVVGQLGLNFVILRYVSAYIDTEKWAKAKGIIKSTQVISAGVSTLIVLFGALTIIVFEKKVAGQSSIAMGIGLLLLLPEVISRLRKFTLQALESIWKSRVPEKIIVPTATLGGTFFLHRVDLLDVNNILLVRLFTLCAIVVILGYLVQYRLPDSVLNAEAEYEWKKVIKTGVPLLLASSAQIIMNRTDIIVLGILGGMGETGAYNAALKISKMSTFGLTAVIIVASPLMAKNYEKQDLEEVKRVFSVSTWVAGIFSLLFMFVIILFGGNILALLGSEYVQAENVLWVMVVAKTISCWVGPVGQFLTMTGYERVFALIIGICAVLNVLMNILLVPVYGAMGAAISTLATTIIWNFGMGASMWFQTDVKPSII